MSGKCLAGATCPVLAMMQLFHAQLLKPQKDEKQGGTSQSSAQHLCWIYHSCLAVGFFVLSFWCSFLQETFSGESKTLLKQGQGRKPVKNSSPSTQQPFRPTPEGKAHDGQ